MERKVDNNVKNDKLDGNLKKNLEKLAGYHSENQYEPSVFKNVENRQKKTTIRNTLILGDSMLRHLKGNNMAKKLRKQKVYVKSYGGANVGDMNHHAIPNLEYNPNHVIWSITLTM